MLTIFSVPKKFEGHFGLIQENAITSWTKLYPKPEIILFGNDQGTAEICQKLKIKHIPQIARNEYHTPLLNDIFRIARTNSSNNTLMFVMADIILLNNPMKIVKHIKRTFDKYLIIGQRYEIKLNILIDFNNKLWQQKLLDEYIKKSKLKGPSWMDYFIFNKSQFSEIPAFAIGRTFWDKWLVWHALSAKIPVIDCSNAIIAAHQSHDYSHVQGNSKWVWEGIEARVNIKQAGGWSHGCNINQSTYIFSNGNIIPAQQNKLTRFLDYALKSLFGQSKLLSLSLLKIRRILNKI